MSGSAGLVSHFGYFVTVFLMVAGLFIVVATGLAFGLLPGGLMALCSQAIVRSLAVSATGPCSPSLPTARV
mgnify:CR=1 FL=1